MRAVTSGDGDLPTHMPPAMLLILVPGTHGPMRDFLKVQVLKVGMGGSADGVLISTRAMTSSLSSSAVCDIRVLLCSERWLPLVFQNKILMSWGLALPAPKKGIGMTGGHSVCLRVDLQTKLRIRHQACLIFGNMVAASDASFAFLQRC